MDLRKLKTLIDLVSESGVAELANKIPEKIKQAYEQGRKKKQQPTPADYLSL